ncbi:hypothetical protein BJ988_002564 [Nocardioides panzhihuensis]|uniref:Uncharacterized protein n=1 Tax=Nocardioides panzhihuensis TaxID=860243 RepID=A0A7Z0ISG5_9ACTN|nr:hypothetical protein [Nocardioides panzhihuensis]
MRRSVEIRSAAGNPRLASAACLPSDLRSDRIGQEPPTR